MKTDKRLALMYILPALILLVAVFIFPLLYAMGMSLFELVRGEWHFVGLRNYARLIADPAVLNGLKTSGTYSAVVVLFHLLLGLATALLLNRKLRGMVVARVLILIPWMVAPSICGVIWRWVWDSQFGIANGLLYSLGLIRTYLPWLGDVNLALISVIVASVWRGFPFIAVLLFAGLQTIPGEQYEAAVVDGANQIQKFIYITVPNLRHVLLVSTTLDIIWTFRGFDMIHTLTGGGPGSATEILPITIYRQAFVNLRFGYASAVSVVLFLFLLTFTVIYIKLVRPADN